MPDRSLRDYGLGNLSKPTGTPTWKPAFMRADPMPYPNCGAQLCEVEVAVDHPLVHGGKGISMYLGCPACPFASPAVVRAGGGGS